MPRCKAREEGMNYNSYYFINFSFLFIGLESTTWPSNNCLQIMVCSWALAYNSNFASSIILLMRSCVHFRQKWQLDFQTCGRTIYLFTHKPEKTAGIPRRQGKFHLMYFGNIWKENWVNTGSYLQRRIYFFRPYLLQPEIKEHGSNFPKA